MSPKRTILLLDLHARSDGFVAGDAFGALSVHLTEAGHAVSSARLTATDSPGTEAFLARIEDASRASSADLVVLARAWDRSLVGAVRRGLPKADVVRLTQGVRAAIDEAFDRVLDPEGLFAFARGDDRAPEAEFQRVKAADLRRRLATVPGTPIAPQEITGRPTISGPSSGCPFLLDARKSPAFADLEMDPSRIQTKGCTFCLDNSGAYVVPDAKDVVATWIAQLRRIREARPDAREVLLTDERPHPYLPAFFEALASDETLPPVELLWKSRTDWLLEYSADVERACEQAARSGSVLHLYLVGFENFEATHLELFNKGHGPEGNERAIEEMRRLQAKYPRSFEHRRYRSHGIVLFTPWTSPEALLENARWMRRLKFDELRSEAIKTRLRLYPRVPLYALAERDGLLASEFEEGRGDRAAEQGYDASVPWRFRDGRTEAIFQLAGALHEADRQIKDCDLIEMATRFVLRFPGLASEPLLAHLPVRAAIEAWGAPLMFLLETLGPAAALFDPEIEAIGRTGKRASLKESVRGTDAEEMARAYRAMGFCAEVVLRHTMDRLTGTHTGGDDHAIVAVASDPASLAEVLAAQRALADTKDREEQSRAVRTLGALMGYSKCCVEAFVRLADRGDNLENERIPFARSPDAILSPLLHRTGVVRLIAHHLCSPDCVESNARATRVVELLGEVDETAPAKLLAAMRTPSLFLDYERFASIEGAFDGDLFRVQSVVSTGKNREFEALLGRTTALLLSPSQVVLALTDGSSRVLPAKAPLLVMPDHPLSGAARASLGPNGSGVEVPPPRASKGAQTGSAAGGASPLRLPAGLRPGVRAATFVVASIDHDEEAVTVRLARGTEMFEVRLRPHVENAPYTLRKGRWAADIDNPLSLSEPARTALSVLVRALPP